jgi:Icc protein
VAAVLFGHAHQAFDAIREGVRYLGCPSTVDPFRPGSDVFARDDAPPGVRWLALHADGTLETEVAWVRPEASGF